LVLGGPLEHAPDQADVDGLGLQCLGAGRVHSVGSPLLDQAEEGIDLAHLGPRQRVLQHRRGIGTDGHAVAGGHPLQPIEVSHGIDALVRGQVLDIGRASARRFAGMDLDQSSAEEQLDQGSVGPGSRWWPIRLPGTEYSALATSQ
jgi:hypothetical protein